MEVRGWCCGISGPVQISSRGGFTCSKSDEVVQRDIAESLRYCGIIHVVVSEKPIARMCVCTRARITLSFSSLSWLALCIGFYIYLASCISNIPKTFQAVWKPSENRWKLCLVGFEIILIILYTRWSKNWMLGIFSDLCNLKIKNKFGTVKNIIIDESYIIF